MINRDALNGHRDRMNGQEIAERFTLYKSDCCDNMILYDQTNGKLSTVPLPMVVTVKNILEDLFSEKQYQPSHFTELI